MFSNNMQAELLLTGQKCLQIVYSPAKVKFRDSVNFIQCRLTDFTKAFQLDVAKTFFPYRFNTVVNRGYIGPLPPMEYYDSGSMKPKEREEFERWWHQEDQRLRSGGLVLLLDSAQNQSERDTILMEWQTNNGEFTDLVWDLQKTLVDYCKTGRLSHLQKSHFVCLFLKKSSFS